MPVSLVVFTVAMFLSAALVFAVQPMAGKTLLPHVGGTPAVWNTCLVFFQAVLLLGYLYADRLTRIRSIGRQVLIHLSAAFTAIVVFVCFTADPEWIPADSNYPIAGLVAFLVVSFGAPFFILSATAPLLQRWFSVTGHRTAADPYFLYAASNAGSLLGLLSYPLLVEPNLTLFEQRAAWTIGLAIFLGLMICCGTEARDYARGYHFFWLFWEKLPIQRTLQQIAEAAAARDSPEADDTHPQPIERKHLFKWIALAALPSSLLMGTTTHLTTDIAPVPLLWVVPLALYLVSFVIVFSRWPESVRRTLGRVTPMVLLFLVMALLTGATEPVLVVAGLHLSAFFVVALLCHGELARGRPPKDHLTTFYLALSVGGVLGGLFNALVAPVLFSPFGLVEYPLAVTLAALVRPDTPLRFTRRDALLVLGFVGFAVVAAWAVPRLVDFWKTQFPLDELTTRLLRDGLMFGVPVSVAFALVRNPVRFAACLAALFLAATLHTGPHGETLLVTRNFFGTLRVTRTPDGKFTRLVHGTTQHGQQRTGSPEPLMYYYRNGPIGRLLTQLPPVQRSRIAAVGLGCGAMAAYAQPGQTWTFYEIDPGVVRIARNPEYFTYLRDCRVEPRIVLGDARRHLDREPDGAFDLIVLDAFSSDAIPVHLLTQEAFAMYVKKLSPTGVLAFHLSNRYLDLPPLVARLGEAHDPQFATKFDDDFASEREERDGKMRSLWVVLYRDAAHLGPVVARDIRWQPQQFEPGPVWTDGFSNLLAVWKREE